MATRYSGIWDLKIVINGKEVNNTLNSVQKEVRELSKDLRKLQPGSDEFVKKSRELKKAQDQFKFLREEIHGVNKTLKEGGGTASNFIKGFAGGFALVEIFKSAASAVKEFISDSIRLAEEAKGVNYAFEQIEGSVQLLERARAATRGLVSDLDIKKAANVFKNFKIDLEPFPELLQFVATRAAQTGESFDHMLSSLVEGLSKESKLRIDNLGISQKELNKELEKTPNFVQAVANIAKVELSKAGNILDVAASTNQKWNVVLENTKLRIGQIANNSGITTAFKKLGIAMLEGVKPAEDILKSVESQARKVIEIEKSLPPLIERYKELKKKTSLTKTEQEELNNVIKKIGEITPSAISSFGKYGEALDISSEAAEKYIETQKAILKYRNAEAISDQKKELADLKAEAELLNNTLQRGSKGVSVSVGTSTVRQQVELKTDEKTKITDRLTELKNLIAGAEGSILELSGDFLENFKKQQAEKVQVALDSARKIADSYKLPYSEENTAAEINAMIQSYESKAGERQKAEEKAAAEELQAKITAKQKANEYLDQIDLERKIQKEIEDLDELSAKQLAEEIELEAKYAKLRENNATETELLKELKEAQEFELQQIEKKYRGLRQEEENKSKDKLQKEEEKYQKEKTKLIQEAEEANFRYREELRYRIISGIEQLAGRETAVGKAVLVAKQLIAAKEALLGLKELQRRAAETKAKAQLSIAEGQAKTASTGFPQNIPFLLAYAAQAITIISAVKGAVDAAKGAKGYYSGGFTGTDSLFNDQYGGVTGVVHSNEWVAPEFMTKSPKYAPVINWLEKERKGPSALNNDSASTLQTSITNNNIISNSDNSELSNQIERLNNILSAGIKTGDLHIGDDQILRLKDRELKLNQSRENAKIQ
jgi:hypothetical protein